ncbi:hypothetical protein DF212_00310 [Lactobacillus johnsonii]|nr:hypothetical protein DF212_00310 [Lactobacillus johnsonii]
MKRLDFSETKRTPRYSLRKLNVGVASVLLGVTIFGINFTNHSVKAATTESVESSSNSQQTKGINAIGAVKVPSLTDSQNDANKAIDDALNTKQSEINGATNIDQTTKDKLIKDATDAADKAKDAINKATTNNDVATEQTDTQKATSATGKVQQSSANNNATANNSTEDATTLQSAPKTQGSAGSGASGSSATGGVVSRSQDSNSQAASATSSAATDSQAAPETQVPAPAASQRSESANSGNATSSPASQAGTVSANHTAIGKMPSSQTVSVDEAKSPAVQSRILMMNLAVVNPNTEDTTLSKSTQTYTLVTQPLLDDYGTHLHDGKRDGKTWVDKNLYWYRDSTLDKIFGTTSNSKSGIITSHPDKYFFAAYVDYSEKRYHRVILLARGQDPSDKNLYSYTIHTASKNTSTTTTKPGESIKEQYTGTGGSTYDLIFQNYGDSFSVKLSGFEGGYGLLPVFDGGLLDPTYGSNTYDQNDEAAKTESIGLWSSMIPQETSTKVRYVDQATGKDIVQPMEISGFGYQGFKINGDAPKIDGYNLVSSPKTLGLSYEDGIIAPYKVGQTYTQYFTDDVYVKQTVIDTNGTVRATAYYKGQPLGASASKILGHDDNNDSMSFMAGGQSYTYNNRINNVDAAMVYYYQKVGEEGKSQLRVHYIDVTKDTDDSQYAPGDGVPATNPISGQELDPITYTGNIGKTYDYATNANAPEGYVLVGTSPNLKGTFSRSDHDAYIYVKIDRRGAKATIKNLTHLNNAQKQAAEAAIDQATDLNTITQAKQDASTLDRAMGTLKQAITDGEATHGTVAYDEADPGKKSTLDNAIKNGQAVTDATNGSNADLTTVKDLSQAIENAQTGLNGDSNLAKAKDQADQNIDQMTNLSADQKKAAKDKINSAKTSSDVTNAKNDANTLNDNLGKLNQAISDANSAKSTPNYTEADSGQQTALDDALSEAEKAKNSNDPSAVATATKHLQDAQSGLNGNSNLAKAKDQADQNIDQMTNLSADQKKAAKDKINSAKTSSDVTNAKNDANTLNDNLGKLNQAISDANSAKSTPNYTEADSGQQTALDDALSEAEKAKNSNDPSAVATATKHLQDAQSGLNGDSNLANTKKQAEQNIDAVAEAAKQAIDKTNGITDSEKQAAKGQVDADANAAKEAIANADSTKAVTDAVNNGTVAINKADANAAIDGALAEKNNSIDAAPNLTAEEKKAVKGQAKTAADSAKTAISNASTVGDVTTAQTNGEKAINAVEIPTASKTKNDANSALDTAADAAKKAIDKTSGLTDDQKQTAKDQIDQAVDAAKENIKNASDNTGVAGATDAGKLAIDKVSAKAAIDGALAEKSNSIDAAPNLTAEEKQAVKDQAQTVADSAKTAISNAATVADVESAKNTGVDNINKVSIPAQSKAKQDAINAINDAATAKKASINNSAILTNEEKSALVNQAQRLADDAIANINKATTNDAVKTAKDTGVETINNMNVPTTSATKDAAKDAIDQAAKAKDDAIDASNLTAEEKDALKKTVAGEVQTAKDNIDAATKDADVKTAQTNGEQAINAVEIPASVSKTDAINAINAALAAKKGAINGTNLTAEEKSTLVGQAQQLADDAIANINKATTNDAVKTAKDTGVETINNMNVPTTSATKDAAKDAIDQAAKAKDDAIDASNLTAEEKDALKKTVAGEVQTAKDNIDAATKDADVKTAQTAGEQAINAVEILTSSKTKNDANSDLDNTADAAKKAIDETSGLTDDQKQTAKDQIDKAVADAKENIENASDNTGVADATDAGKLAIDKVSAKAAIDAAVAAKKSKIAKTPLTAEEAKPLNDLVDQEADTAKDAIDAATTNAVVEAAKNNGVETINNINVPATSATKDDTNKAIDDALAKKIEEINNANLTNDQKQSLIDQAQNAANQAKENVRSASTDEDVQTAKNNGIAAINGITVKSNSVDDQDNSATNEGNGNQAGHIQSDNSSDVTKHSSTQQSGNEKDKLPQTGNEIQRGAGLVGLAIAGLAILLGSAGFRKKRD